jgi:hypothetical protein
MEIPMKMSDTITAIAPALVRAQSQIEDAVKDSTNPAFKSKYADLSSVLAVIRKPMADNDLCVLQSPVRADGGVDVETMILHKSGEWVSQSCFIPINKSDAHGTGSGITYGRRYGLMSIFCIGTEDDDASAAVSNAPAKAPASPELFKTGLKAATEGQQKLTAWWNTLPEADRNSLNSTQRAELKKAASAVDAKSKTEDK